MSQKLKFIWVGRLKKKFWQEAAAFYLSRLSHFYPLQETVVKDSPGNLSPAKKIALESKNICQKITARDLVVLLDEQGKHPSSADLAQKLQLWLEDPGTIPCFVLGGPYGVDRTLQQRADFRLSLGRMTLPHELARITLLEQLYRASTIIRGHPYHH